MSRAATTVGAILCAAHRDREGRLHGHTWTVWARFAWKVGQQRDALALQKRLQTALTAWDHAELPPGCSIGEEIAAAVAQLLGGPDGCDYVLVERPAEMIKAEWWA